MKKNFDPKAAGQEDGVPKGVGKGVMIAYGILLLHLLLLLGIGLLILILRGLIDYVSLIFLAVCLLLFFLGYLAYKKFKKGRADLEGILRHPDFADKNLEIRLLGGLASLRVEEEKNRGWQETRPKPLILESPRSARFRELRELGIMYEKNLLTAEEYELAKKQIFNDFKIDDEAHLLLDLATPPNNSEDP